MTQSCKMQGTELAGWEPMEALSPFGVTFGRLFDDIYGASGRRGVADGERLMALAVDVVEDAQSLTVSAELPGMKKEDVRIQVENGVLTISGEKKFDDETPQSKDKNFHRVERRYGSFYRALSLPKGVASDAAEATFTDGVLTVRFPKSEEVKPKVVKIK